MKRFINIASLISIYFLQGCVIDNNSHVKPVAQLIDSQFDQADYVIIGEAIEKQDGIGLNRIPISWYKFHVTRVLKGEKFETVLILVKSERSFDSVKCCDKGKQYLLYLVKLENSKFAPYDGARSIFELSGIDRKPNL